MVISIVAFQSSYNVCALCAHKALVKQWLGIRLDHIGKIMQFLCGLILLILLLFTTTFFSPPHYPPLLPTFGDITCRLQWGTQPHSGERHFGWKLRYTYFFFCALLLVTFHISLLLHNFCSEATESNAKIWWFLAILLY